MDWFEVGVLLIGYSLGIGTWAAAERSKEGSKRRVTYRAPNR